MTSKNNRIGSIKAFVGPMSSGKSARIYEHWQEAKVGRKNILLFKPRADTRCSDKKIKSRNGNELIADFEISTLEEMNDLLQRKIKEVNIELAELIPYVPEDILHKIDQFFKRNSFELKVYLNTLCELDEKVLVKLINVCNKLPEIVLVEEVQFLNKDSAYLQIRKACKVIQQLADSGIHFIFFGLDQTHERVPFLTTALLMAIADKVIKLKARCYNCGEKEAVHSKALMVLESSYVAGGEDLYAASCRRCFNLIQNQNKLDLSVCNSFNATAKAELELLQT